MSTPVLGDSNAYLDNHRVLPQHQVALAFIRERALNPRVARVRWLDLACGRGQILTNLEQVLSAPRRQKINYTGIDVVLDYAREVEQRASALFGRVRVEICHLDRFELHLQNDDEFDVITLTNSAHELTPEDLAKILVAGLCRLSDGGLMYLYDMEKLPELELGAIPWEREEIQQVFDRILGAAGLHDELPEVASWPHSTCTCWHLQIHREHLNISRDNLRGKRSEMIAAASSVIREILERKFLSTHGALQAVSAHGAENSAEVQEIYRLLYDFWSISRALGRPLEIPVKS